MSWFWFSIFWWFITWSNFFIYLISICKITFHNFILCKITLSSSFVFLPPPSTPFVLPSSQIHIPFNYYYRYICVQMYSLTCIYNLLNPLSIGSIFLCPELVTWDSVANETACPQRKQFPPLSQPLTTGSSSSRGRAMWNFLCAHWHINSCVITDAHLAQATILSRFPGFIFSVMSKEN